MKHSLQSNEISDIFPSQINCQISVQDSFRINKKIFFQNIFLLFPVLIFLFLSGCTTFTDSEKSQVAFISISPSSLVVAGVDSSYQLSLSGKFISGANIESFDGATWSSSDNTLATVNSSGLVTIHAQGKASIIVEYLGVKDSISIEIVEVSALALFPVNLKVTALNQTFSLNIQAKDALDRSIVGFNGVTWASSDTNIASVDALGKITTHAAGSVSITATHEGIVDTSNIVVDESGGLIQGIAQYEDRLYDSTGFTSNGFKAIRYATVELLDENSEILLSVATDETGAYSLGNVVPDTYSVRLLAEVKAAPAAGFAIKDMQGALYSYTKSSVVNTLTYAFDLGLTLSGTGAFNLLDVVTASAEYSKNVLNVDPIDLQIYWETGSGLVGTYYCTGYDQYDCFNNKGIYIIGELSTPENMGVLDTDEFDDDVIMHEFAHFLTSNYSIDDSIGGNHIITQNDSDLRLSWSEGWGTFFPSAVKSWLQSQHPELISSAAGTSIYVDTIGDQAGLSHNIATGEIGDGFFYASSEAAVGRILWNLLQDFGMPKLWDVMVNYFPTSDKPTSLPLFWDGLLASDLYLSSELPQLESIFAERRVFYQIDASETDDTLLTATNQAVDAVPNVTNTLYSDELISDIDYISFNAVAGQSYSVLTTELYNGADTLIRLYRPDGTLVAVNDDAIPDAYFAFDQNFGIKRVTNSTTAMASQIDFTADVSGQYAVEIKFADKQHSDFDFVGHYGSYKLFISSK